jgi:uncharacterized protein (DUF1330 family)
MTLRISGITVRCQPQDFFDSIDPIRKSNGIAIQVLLGGSHQDPRKSFGAASRTIRTLSVQSAEKTPSSRSGLTALDRRVGTEGSTDDFAERLGTVDDEQPADFGVETAFNQMKWSIPAMSFSSFAAGVVVGIAAHSPQPLRAADRLAVYTVYEANVIDPEGYKNNFLKVVGPKLEKHGIKYLVRGGAPKALIGEPPKDRLVITRAKDMDAVMAFWNDSKDDFQNIATKYANGIRWYAAEGLAQ